MIQKDLIDGTYYGNARGGNYKIYVLVVKDGIYKTPFSMSNKIVEYDGYCPANTYECTDQSELISKDEFEAALKNKLNAINVPSVFIKTTTD